MRQEAIKKIGVVGIAGGWSTERLLESVEHETGFRILIEMKTIRYDSETDTLYYGHHNFLDLDALIVKKLGPVGSPDHIQRLGILSHVRNSGVPIFSDPENIVRCMDRLNCTMALRLAGIPMPPTVLTEDIDKGSEAIRRFGKAVLKPLFSTKAKGMIVLDGDDRHLIEKIHAFKNDGNRILYIQKMVEIPGRDLGVAFLDGVYIGTYARVGKKDSWNTTTSNGGTYEPYDPSNDIITLARKAQSVFNLSFTCVDVAETSAGPIVFEVSALGGFRGLWESRQLDVSGMIVNHVMRSIS
ncbi:MAG: GAK system ATP-grasp enzyme [Pseudomonadota bacterium]